MSRLRTIEKNRIPKVAHVEDYDSDESSIKPSTRKEARQTQTIPAVPNTVNRYSKEAVSDSGYASLATGEQASLPSARVKRYEDDQRETGHRWDRARFERYDAGRRWDRGVYEDDRYARSSDYDAPRPIVIREERPSKSRQNDIDEEIQRLESERRRGDESSENVIKPLPEENYFYERRIRERKRSRSREPRSEIRAKESESGYSSDDSYEYVRRERTYSDHEDEPHHKRRLAEGALAGIAAAENIRSYRDSDERHHIGLSGAFIGGLVHPAFHRARSKDRHRSVHRRTSRSRFFERRRDRSSSRDSRSRSRSRSRSTPRDHVRGLAGVAGIGALAGYALKHRDKKEAMIDYEGGLQRSRSRGRRVSADESGENRVSRSRSRGPPGDSRSPSRSQPSPDTSRKQPIEGGDIAGLAERALKKNDRDEALLSYERLSANSNRSEEQQDDTTLENVERDQYQAEDMWRELDVVASEVHGDPTLTPPPEPIAAVEEPFPKTKAVRFGGQHEIAELDNVEVIREELLADNGVGSTSGEAAAVLDQFDFDSFFHQTEGQWPTLEDGGTNRMSTDLAEMWEELDPKRSVQSVANKTATRSSSLDETLPRTDSSTIRYDEQEIPWMTFQYPSNGVNLEYNIRCDIDSVDLAALSVHFRKANSAYTQYLLSKGWRRFAYEVECNEIGWALVSLNPILRREPDLIRRAVDLWRSNNQDPRLRSRRVRRQAKSIPPMTLSKKMPQTESKNSLRQSIKQGARSDSHERISCERCAKRKVKCDTNEPCGPCARTDSPCIRTESLIAGTTPSKGKFEASSDERLPLKSSLQNQALEDLDQDIDTEKATAQELSFAKLEDDHVPESYETNEVASAGHRDSQRSPNSRIFTRAAAAFAIPQPLLRLTRHKLLSGLQRLEWRCSCGKQMYGDYAQRDAAEGSKLFQSLPDCKVLNSAPTQSVLVREQTSRLWRPTLLALLKDAAIWAGIATCRIYSILPRTHYFKIIDPIFDSNSLHNYGFRMSGPRSLRVASRLLELDRAVIASVAIVASGFALLRSLKYIFATRWRRRMFGIALAFPINLIMTYFMTDIRNHYYEIITSLLMCAGLTMDILETCRDNLMHTKRNDAAATDDGSPSGNDTTPSNQATSAAGQGNSLTPVTTSNISGGSMGGTAASTGIGASSSPGKMGISSSNPTTTFIPLDATKPAFFELCVNGSKTRVALGEITLGDGTGRSNVRTDMELFKKIHEQYAALRRKGLYKYLYRPSNIHFVRFGVHRGGYQTGIYERPLAVPPAEEVENQRYHYYECPLDPLPPIDPGTFFHYFWEHDKHPHTTGHPGFDSLFFNRLPKKLGDSVLKQDDPRSLQKGWGVHIIEGPNKPLLAWLATAILISSFLISLVYDIVFKNKESGFAIGQWIVAVLATALTAMYFHLADLA